jgi:hypothetical protein
VHTGKVGTLPLLRSDVSHGRTLLPTENSSVLNMDNVYLVKICAQDITILFRRLSSRPPQVIQSKEQAVTARCDHAKVSYQASVSASTCYVPSLCRLETLIFSLDLSSRPLNNTPHTPKDMYRQSYLMPSRKPTID